VEKFDVERFNLKNINNVEVKEQYHVKFSNRFAALEKLDSNDVDIINRAWEREYESFSHREFRLF
jgi:hypothetical protein